eukprot:scaffold147624_cov37-Tisochrysis_lutea.AAC.1
MARRTAQRVAAGAWKQAVATRGAAEVEWTAGGGGASSRPHRKRGQRREAQDSLHSHRRLAPPPGSPHTLT